MSFKVVVDYFFKDLKGGMKKNENNKNRHKPL